MTPAEQAELEVSSLIAEMLLERRAKAFKVWRKRQAELGDGNAFLRSQMGSIRSIAAELIGQDIWTCDHELATAELKRLAGRA